MDLKIRDLSRVDKPHGSVSQMYKMWIHLLEHKRKTTSNPWNTTSRAKDNIPLSGSSREEVLGG